jgi:hypothetical protein
LQLTSWTPIACTHRYTQIPFRLFTLQPEGRLPELQELPALRAGCPLILPQGLSFEEALDLIDQFLRLLATIHLKTRHAKVDGTIAINVRAGASPYSETTTPFGNLIPHN